MGHEAQQGDQGATVAWTFEATNLITGEAVPVASGLTPGGDGIRIDISGPGKESVTVRFPARSSTEIIEARARAEITDANGQKALTERRFWSHQFRSATGDATEAATLVQALAGLDDTSALVPYDLGRERPQLPGDARTRRADILNAYLRATVRDRRITVDELRKVIAALHRRF